LVVKELILALSHLHTTIFWRSPKIATLTAREEKSIFSAFPNPTVNDFAIHIDGKEGEFADVMVYDAAGLPVESFRSVNVNTEFHVGGGWPRGLYYVKVYKAGEVYTGQIGKK
jgi:hypothetical protein